MDIELYKRRKKELHFTFDELAKRSGVSRRALTQIFSNPESSNPTTATIQKIERALGIGWTDEELAQGVSPVMVRNVTPEEDDLLEYFRELGINILWYLYLLFFLPQKFPNFYPTKIPRKKPRLFGAFIFWRTSYRRSLFCFFDGRQPPELSCIRVYRSYALAALFCYLSRVHAHPLFASAPSAEIYYFRLSKTPIFAPCRGYSLFGFRTRKALDIAVIVILCVIFKLCELGRIFRLHRKDSVFVRKIARVINVVLFHL